MKQTRTLRAAATGLVLAMALTACGQKPGVRVEAAGAAAGGDASLGGGVATLDGGVATLDGGGDGSAPALDADLGGGTADLGGGTADLGGGTADLGGGTAAPADSGGGAPAPADTGGGGAAAPADTSGGGGEQAAAPPQETAAPAQSGGGKAAVVGSDRTGAGADKIVLGVHAPTTGAAPLPSTSFETLRDLYWKNLIEDKGGDVLGRKKVEVIFQDDKYDPNSATQVCRQLAASSFTVTGGGGTDQIQACGKLANVQKFPYFSPGVTENGLTGNPWYFGASMTYKSQGMLLAQYIKKAHGGKKVGAIITKTANFDDAVAGFQAGAQQAGLNLAAGDILRHPQGDTSWYASYVDAMKASGVEVLYILSSPVDYIRFANKAAENSYAPAYVGVGVSKAINAVLANGCPALNGGVFFSPFPGLDYARQNIPDYFAAASKRGLNADDLGLALWGLAEVQHETFKAYGNTFGNDLTREGYRALVETLTVKTKTFPAIQWSPGNHFGGKQVHVLQADCGTKTHKTLATFATGF